MGTMLLAPSSQDVPVLFSLHPVSTPCPAGHRPASSAGSGACSDGRTRRRGVEPCPIKQRKAAGRKEKVSWDHKHIFKGV